MRKKMQELMGSEKYIIAAIHLLPLPGSPNYDRQSGVKVIIDRTKEDVEKLAENGVHSFLFTNEADMPYEFRLKTETVTVFSAVVNEVMQKYKIPFGINALVDAHAGLCIAHATGASFIRGLFSGVYISDMGIIENQAPKIFRTRTNLTNKHIPYFFHNLSSITGPMLIKRSADIEAASIINHIEVDGFTLPAENLDMFLKVRKIVPNLPIVVGSGTNFQNLNSLLNVCDGTIVATCLREEGKLLNPVDTTRTERFMKLFGQSVNG